MMRALLFLLISTPALAAEVTLRETAIVTGDFVRVCDIASVTGENAEAAGATLLAPVATASCLLTADDVRRRLTAAGLWTAESSIAGSTRCLVVKRPEQRLAAAQPANISQYDVRRASEKLARRVQERLTDAFPGRAFDVTVELSEADAPHVLADSAGRLTGGSSDLSQPQELVLVSDRPVRFTARLSETPAILVAAASLPRGTILRAIHLTRAPVGEPGVGDPSAVLGQELQRPLAAGRPVTPRDVKPVVLVRNGAIVTVTVDAPGVRVSRQMKSRDSGGIGEAIQCVSLDGKKIVAATVTGPNTASVGPSPTRPTTISDETGTVTIQTTGRATGRKSLGGTR